MSDDDQPQETPAQETDWKAHSRDWEAKSKKNYTDLQAAQSELQKAQERITELESTTTDLTEQVQGYESEKQHAALVKQVAEATGVPSDVLRGGTEEELTAHAESLKELMKPSAPIIDNQAKTPGDPPVDPNTEAVRSLFGQ